MHRPTSHETRKLSAIDTQKVCESQPSSKGAAEDTMREEVVACLSHHTIRPVATTRFASQAPVVCRRAIGSKTFEMLVRWLEARPITHPSLATTVKPLLGSVKTSAALVLVDKYCALRRYQGNRAWDASETRGRNSNRK